jgi:hypothetical protein
MAASPPYRISIIVRIPIAQMGNPDTDIKLFAQDHSTDK